MTYARRSAKRGCSWPWWALASVAVLCMAAISIRMLSIAGFFEQRPVTSIRLRAPLREEMIGPAPPVRNLAPSTPPTAEVVELSEGKAASSDVLGNLAPASVVTRKAPGKDWLKDRWQAAKNMQGSPIPGEHWLCIDLGNERSQLSIVELDFEAAFAKSYVLETASSKEGPWHPLAEVESCCTKNLKVNTTGQHVVHKLSTSEPWRARRFVRARFTKLGTNWGVSVFRFRLFGSTRDDRQIEK
ncbi:unnamed protein product [Symbiodinium sp. CCMP2592]|nr:unnamed protein product [Symbiodinium sp. CCMP2592]